jgi:uncharacterized protein YjbI with pentapeptide repeats
MAAPRFLDDPAYKCLRSGDLEGFRQATEGRKTVDFTGADLRGTDFRKLVPMNLVLRDAYLRDADLRGCDLRNVDMAGASLERAKISGAYFPLEIDAAEIQLSMQYGTRLRVRK